MMAMSAPVYRMTCPFSFLAKYRDLHRRPHPPLHCASNRPHSRNATEGPGRSSHDGRLPRSCKNEPRSPRQGAPLS
jgi:hypothetical protein